MRKNYTFLKILLAVTCGFIAGILSAAAHKYTNIRITGIMQWGVLWIAGAYFLSRLGKDAWISAVLGALFLLMAVFGYLWAQELLGAAGDGTARLDWNAFSRWAASAVIAGGGIGLLGTFGGVKSAAGCAAQSLIPSVFLAIALYCLFNFAQYKSRLGFIGIMLLAAVLLHSAVYGRYAASSRSMLATLSLAVLWLILYATLFPALNIAAILGV